MNLSNVDLNLFFVLHVVLEEGSVTRAARRLAVTQSAVSNALARLRETLQDPLFVRKGRGLVATPRAKALRPQLEAAMVHLRHLVESDSDFDARKSTRRMMLACADYHEVATVPRVLELFRERLPNASLCVVSKDFEAKSDGLASGEIDAALMPRIAIPKGIHFEELFSDDRAVLVARSGHPRLKKGVTREVLTDLDHIEVVVSPGGRGVTRSKAQERLAASGLKRRIALSVPHFTSAAMIAARSDLVVVMPGRLAEELVKIMPLKSFDLPLHIPEIFQVCLCWHERTLADPGARYFRQIVIDALRSTKRS